MNARIFTLRRVYAAATALSVVAVAPSAHAGSYYDYANAAMHASDIISTDNSNTQQVEQGINSMSQAIQQALLNLSGQQSANIQAMTQAQANIATVQDQRAVTMRVEDAKVQAATAATSGASVCNVITGAIRTSGLDGLLAAWRSQAVQAQLALAAGYPNGVGSPQNTDQNVNQFLLNHCSQAATAEDVATGICPGASITAANPVVADDENADIILGQTTLTPDQSRSADRYMALAANPTMTGRLPVGIASTPEGRRRAFEMESDRARASVAMSVMASLKGEATIIAPDSPQGQQAEAWAEATAKASGLAAPVDPATGKYFPNGISELGYMQLRSKGWYFNPNWGVQLSGQNVDATAKDMAMMQSWQVYMEYKQYMLLREMDMSLAVISATLIENKGVS